MASRFLVINRSPYTIDLLVPHPTRSSTSILLQPSNAIDIAPWAGGVENCRRIAQLHDLKYKGWIEIMEE
jgi:hypothetical protein